MAETSLTWLGRLVATPTGDDWMRLTAVYAPLLSTWAARAGVAAANRDDVVQDVMVVVVRRIADFEHRGSGAFRAWLRGILANCIQAHFRERSGQPDVDLDAIADPVSVLGQQWDREHDEYHAVRAMRVVEADFHPTTWIAFHRQVIDGVPPAQVAVELGISHNAAILAKARVLRRLREELQGLVE